jgi:hypothetical protein
VMLHPKTSDTGGGNQRLCGHQVAWHGGEAAMQFVSEGTRTVEEKVRGGEVWR